MKNTRLFSFSTAILCIVILSWSIVFVVKVSSQKVKFSPSTMSKGKHSLLSLLQPELMPWQAVGGCGAGGSGGGSKGIRWIGEGVSGGLVEVEVLPKLNFGKNFQFLTLAPRISAKPKWNTTVGFTLPISTKTAEVQYKTNQAANTRITGGMGDIICDISRTFGSEGQYNLMFSMSFPTGQYDIKRSAEQTFLPINLQMGTGVYMPSLTFTYTRDVQNGLFLFDGYFTYPFTARPFTKENEFLDTYFKAYKNVNDPRFYYRAKAYGENDLGDYFPPSVGFSAYYGYRGMAHYVHSFGLTFYAPLGVTWIHSEKSYIYDPRPDPDFKAWEATLSYGLEFSKPDFPVFIGIALPIHDKSPGDKGYDPEPMKKWDAPDGKDLLQQWIFAVGFKASMF